MSSFKRLREDWATLHATFAQKIRDSQPASIISSDVQYATAAWHNKLKVWREDLDQLIAEYTPEFGHAHLTGLSETPIFEGSLERPQECDAARV